jgi:hypothetical protein
MGGRPGCGDDFAEPVEDGVGIPQTVTRHARSGSDFDRKAAQALGGRETRLVVRVVSHEDRAAFPKGLLLQETANCRTLIDGAGNELEDERALDEIEGRSGGGSEGVAKQGAELPFALGRPPVVEAPSVRLFFEEKARITCGERTAESAEFLHPLARERCPRAALAVASADLGSVLPRADEAVRSKETIDVLDGSPAHESESPSERAFERSEERGRAPSDDNRFGPLRERQERAVDVQEESVASRRRKGRGDAEGRMRHERVRREFAAARPV